MSMNRLIACVLIAFALFAVAVPVWTKPVPYALPNADRALVAEAEMETKASAPAEAAYLATLKPAAVGVSFVLAPPIIDGSDQKNISFAVGCWFWLQCAIAQTPGCEQTSIPGEIRAVADFKHIPHWRLPQKDAGDIATMLGACYLATGHLYVSGNRQRLEYVLFNIHGRQLGAPVSASGSRDEIVAQLPVLRAKLLSLAKIACAPSVIPALTSANVAELISASTIPVPADKITLKDLARKNPIISCARLWFGGRDEDFVSLFANQATKHPYLLAIALDKAAWDAPALDKHLAELVDGPCNSYALLAAAGWRHWNRGDVAGGRLLFERAVKRNPKNSIAWEQLAEALESESQRFRRARTWDKISREESARITPYYPKGIAAARRSVNLALDNVDALHELAVACSFGGLSMTASLSLDKALSLDPENMQCAYWGLEMYQPKWGGTPEAVVRFVRRVKKHSCLYHREFVAAYYALSAVKDDSSDAADLLKNLDLDVQSYVMAPDDDPDSMSAALIMSWNHRDPSQIKARKDLAQRYIRLRPDYAEGYYCAGRICSDCGEFDQAQAYYSKAISISPNYEEAICCLASLCYSNQKFDQSIKWYQRLIELSPTANYYRWKGESYERLHQDNNAISTYKKGIETSSAEPECYEALANYSVSHNKPEEAVDCLTKLAEINPWKCNYSLLGTAYVLVHQDDNALAAYKTGLTFHPKDQSLAYSLYNYYFSHNRLPEAVPYLEMLSQQMPNNAWIWLNLAAAYNAAGQTQKAKGTWEKVSALDPGPGHEGDIARKRLAELAAKPNVSK
ncbi:MAG: tetratricopeptide repeat protein [Capsulimonadaceae bacterium]|nr:tetratricopeptide repeat protein [Capsulimonadaceae bacterium]